MTQGSPKPNPESGQSDIWTQNIRMQIQHPDHWATLPMRYPRPDWKSQHQGLFYKDIYLVSRG